MRRGDDGGAGTDPHDPRAPGGCQNSLHLRHSCARVLSQLPGAIREVLMLEFLAYTVFAIMLFGCLRYVMGSLDIEESRERE